MRGHPAGERVWDAFVRVFHWTLVACVLLDLFLLEEGDAAHRWAGYLASALVLARVAWGLVAPSPHARLAAFFPSWRAVARQLRDLADGRPVEHAGHSPAGAVMMLFLMALVLSLGVTGWLLGTDALWGSEPLEELHEFLSNALLASVAVHASAAWVMGRVERVRLVRAMITGRRERY